MSTAIHRMVEDCRKGRCDRLIARLPSGWALMGASQFLSGYSLLLPDPVVPHLNAMTLDARNVFLADMASLGGAVLRATGALRINYAMFGNLEPALHVHVIPRFVDEADALRTAHPWAYDWNAAPQFQLSVHGELLGRIRDLVSTRSDD